MKSAKTGSVLYDDPYLSSSSYGLIDIDFDRPDDGEWITDTIMRRGVI